MPLHQTDFDNDKFGYPAVDDAFPGNPKNVECATILSLLDVGGWRLVDGSW